MFESGLRQWQVAKLLGISEARMSQKLRWEMPREEQEKIIGLISERGAQYETDSDDSRGV